MNKVQIFVCSYAQYKLFWVETTKWQRSATVGIKQSRCMRVLNSYLISLNKFAIKRMKKYFEDS